MCEILHLCKISEQAAVNAFAEVTEETCTVYWQLKPGVFG